MLNILDEVGMSGCKPCDTSVDPNCKLSEDADERLLDVGRYQQMVEKLT